MQRESKKYLEDVRLAAARIAEFTNGKELADYQRDAMLRSAVERQFEIVGEAINQLARVDEPTARLLGDYRRMVDFRNVLIHGYSLVNPVIVWAIVEEEIPSLLTCLKAISLQTGE